VETATHFHHGGEKKKKVQPLLKWEAALQGKKEERKVRLLLKHSKENRLKKKERPLHGTAL